VTEMPTIRFSAARHRDLNNLGVIDEQIGELEAVLPMCKLLIESGARLGDTRDDLDKLIKALRTVERVVSGRTKAAREALNRWQMAAYARRHPLGSDPEFVRILALDTLIGSAREAMRALGRDQRRSHAATPEPIQLIADALVTGWAKRKPDTQKPAPYCMPLRKFREIVQYAYEAIGAPKDYVPERALRAYRDWRKKDVARRRSERDSIT
jgi:hypothetical protein